MRRKSELTPRCPVQLDPSITRWVKILRSVSIETDWEMRGCHGGISFGMGWAFSGFVSKTRNLTKFFQNLYNREISDLIRVTLKEPQNFQNEIFPAWNYLYRKTAIIQNSKVQTSLDSFILDFFSNFQLTQLSRKLQLMGPFGSPCFRWSKLCLWTTAAEF